MNPTSASTGSTHLRWVEGERSILALLPALQKSAVEWGQDIAALQLPYALSVPTVPRRSPILVTFHRSEDVKSEQILGAVLVFGYGGWPFRRRLLTNADRLGRLGVFGPSMDRMRLALLAIEALLEGGAALVRLDFLLEEEFSRPATDIYVMSERQKILQRASSTQEAGVSFKVDARVRPFEFALMPDLDSNLASLGRRTRRNIRAARRKCELDLGCKFQSQASVSLSDFLRFNQSCWHRVSNRVARWRYTSASSSPGFLCGLRAANGEWMCLVGGRLLHDTVMVDWQMNAPAFIAYSVSLTMRGYVMEAFGQQGMRRLYFEGGTSHIMTDQFLRRTVYQVEARRPLGWLRLLERCLKMWFPQRAMTRSLFGARFHSTSANPDATSSRQ